MTDIDALAARYEQALQAHWDDRDDEDKHAESIAAAQDLAEARTADREADIAAGLRSPGVGVRADEVRRDNGTIGYRDEPAGGGN